MAFYTIKYIKPQLDLLGPTYVYAVVDGLGNVKFISENEECADNKRKELERMCK